MPRVFLPAILSGVLLWTAFFPLNVGPVAFVALVPWLSLVRANVSRRRRYFAAYLGGVTFFALATNWVRVAHPMMIMSWIGLSVVMPITWVFALDFIRRLDRNGVPLAFSVPLGWVGLEYARMHFPTGFPFLQPLGMQHMIGFGWYFLGYSQHAFTPLIQIADLGGVYAVSFLVAAVNGAIAEWVLRKQEPLPNPSPEAGGALDPSLLAPPSALGKGVGGLGSEAENPSPTPPLKREELKPASLSLAPPSALGKGVGGLGSLLPSLVVLLLFGASLGYGYFRLSHPEFTPGPRVAAIQGSISQGEKMQGGPGLRETYVKLHVAARDAEQKPDLIVWPETCFSTDWFEVAPGQTPSEAFAEHVAKCERYFRGLEFGPPVLLGLNGNEWENGREWKYNSALLLDTQSHKLGRYDKMHLVPFGEYVPLGNWLPFMEVFTPYEKGYSCRPGEHWTRFPLAAGDKQYKFGCLICYEDSDPSLARQYVAAQPVDFLVNISNDGWFDGTEEHEQHFAICRFRAIEARRSVVRAVNMGISGVIDSDGRVIAIPRESWSASKKVEGVVSAVVPIDGRGSWYATLGDVIPGLCWLAVIVSFVLAWRRKAAAE